MVASTTARQNPFPGLRPFREDEERFFFGREHQVDTMVNKLAATRFLAVVGTSGSGKSSLVNCGLRPGLHRGLMATGASAWRMAQFRPGSNPIQSLAEALAAKDVLFSGSSAGVPMEEIVETYLNQSAKGIVDAFRKARLPEGTNLLVVADQFEELFRYQKLETADGQNSATQETAIAFVNLLLAAAVEPDCPIYVVITMRSDFLGDCAQFYGLPEAINRAQYLVPRMTREERRASIAGPIGVCDAEISPVLLTRLVNDVGDNPDQLSILQHALHRTWDCWESHGGQGALDLEHYAEIGTMTEALNQDANEAYDLLTTSQQIKACEKLFKALTDLGTDIRGIRRPLKLAKLAEIAAPNGDHEEIKSIIKIFRDPSRAFLMPPVPEPLEPETVIDISHESLMRVWKRLRTWAEEEARSARQYRRLEETAALEKIQKARLWRDPDLQLALDWKEDEAPTKPWADLYGGDFQSAMAFLERSRAERDRELAEVVFQRRWRRWRWLILFVVIAGISAFRLNENYDDRNSVRSEAADIALGPTKRVQTTQASKPPETSPSLETKTNMFRGRIANFYHLLRRVVRDLGPYIAGYFLLATSGKWLLRRFTFPKILKEVAVSSTKAARERKLAQQAEGNAVDKLQTKYASLRRRFGAYLLDTALFAIVSIVLLAGMLITAEYLTSLLGPWADTLLFIPLIIDWLYHAMMLRSRREGTLGMLAYKIMTTGEHGERLNFRRTTAVYFARTVTYLTVGVGFFSAAFTAKHQTVHDSISHTVVLRRRDEKEIPIWILVLSVLAGLLDLCFFIFLVLLVGAIFFGLK